MKRVNSLNLEIGQIYYDNNFDDEIFEVPAQMRYAGRSSRGKSKFLIFEPIKNCETYDVNDDGFITIGIQDDPEEDYYFVK